MNFCFAFWLFLVSCKIQMIWILKETFFWIDFGKKLIYIDHLFGQLWSLNQQFNPKSGNLVCMNWYILYIKTNSKFYLFFFIYITIVIRNGIKSQLILSLARKIMFFLHILFFFLIILEFFHSGTSQMGFSKNFYKDH